MADFKTTDQKCRIHPNIGTPIACTFDAGLADEIYALLRLPVRIEGVATINSQTERVEEIAISSVKPLEPISLNAGNFFRGWSLDQLAQLQGVEPIRNPKTLAGGWPADEDPDEVENGLSVSLEYEPEIDTPHST